MLTIYCKEIKERIKKIKGEKMTKKAEVMAKGTKDSDKG